MSEVFEGIVVNAGVVLPDSLSMPMAASEIVGGAIVLYRIDERAAAAFSPRVDELASFLSRGGGRCLVVRYDSRIGHRSSTLYVDGSLKEAFDERSELFVRLDDVGEPILTEPPITRGGFLPGEEYETAVNAIQLGLSAFGDGEWNSLYKLMTSV